MPILQSALEKVNAEAVGIDVGVYLVIGLGTIILFNFLRPNNKVSHALQCRPLSFVHCQCAHT